MVDIAGARTFKFHSAGREDIDVRMLGNGRPFIMEFENPRRAYSAKEELEKFQTAETGDLVKISDVKFVEEDYFVELKAGEKTKSKVYTCFVWVKDKITPEMLRENLDSVRDLTVYQKTPLRVLHRRSLMTREKKFYRLKSEYINPNFFILHVLASAGAYIKEFVHSDLGRTVPNVGSLLNTKADILQLDVTNLFTEGTLDINGDEMFQVRDVDLEE